jgi:hypothetical protein
MKERTVMVELKGRILLLIYKTLLIDYGISAVKEVFEKNPLVVEDHSFTSMELYSTIYNDKLPLIPFEYVISIYSNIEDYLKSNNKPLKSFMTNLLHKRTRAFLISSGNEMLDAIEPYIRNALDYDDPRYFILDHTDIMHKIHLPESNMNTVFLDISASKTTAIIEVMYSYDEYEKYKYNPEPWKGYIIETLPRAFGGGPFDSVVARSDSRTFDDILGVGNYSVRDGEVFVDGEKVGVLMSYQEYSQELGLDCTKTKATHELLGIRTTRSVVSAPNDYLKLRANCFYGAPATLFQVEFKPVKEKVKGVLRKIIRADTPAADGDELEFEALHQELLEQTTDTLSVVFDASNHRILINGNPLTRSFPAVLFYHFCMEYTKSNKSTYFYQELVTIPELRCYLDPIRPNLDIRVKRLRDKLRERCPSFEIHFIRTGCVSFSCSSKFYISKI